MRPRFEWKLRSRTLVLGPRTLVVGVINVTPDSFSDGGVYFSTQRAVEAGLQMLEQGADILDLGGESTRPGAESGDRGVSADEEMARVLPVVDALLEANPKAILSVDTTKARVAEAAAHAGAEIINDVSGFRWDPQMAATVAGLQCGTILVHTRGRPDEWRSLPPCDQATLVETVKRELADCAQAAAGSGVARERVVLDPGFGFGKNFDDNYLLLAHLSKLRDLGYPLMAGTSRKSFIGRTLAEGGRDAPAGERLYGSLASEVAAILAGAHLVRAHDVRPIVEAAKIADAIVAAS